jgi:hypothetical protein
MAAPYFKQISSLPFYAMDLDASAAPYWAGYLAGPNFKVTPIAYPSTVWNDDGGTFIFMNEAPKDTVEFYKGLTSLLPNLSPTKNIRMLWIYNPKDSWQYWQYDFIKAKASGNEQDLSWTVERNASFSVGTYSVQIAAGAPFTLEDAKTLAISFPTDQVTFTTYNGSFEPQGADVSIPLWGKTIGTFQVYLKLSHSNFDGLNVMLRYGFVGESSESNPFGGVEMLDMPLFKFQSEQKTMDLLLSFCPVSPTVQDRCYLSFFPYDNSVPPTFNAGFVTTQGAMSTLTPAHIQTPFHPAKLVFNKTPTSDPNGGQSGQHAYHITPDGAFDFEIIAQPSGKPIQLINGLSAQEFIHMPTHKAICFFKAGQPAFKGGAPEHDSNKNISHLLSDSGTTAHLSILTESTLDKSTYYAQSNQASLFKQDEHTDSNFLNYHGDMPVVEMPQYTMGSGDAPKTYAMGCYHAINSRQAELSKKVEANAISLFRRYQIGQIGTKPTPPPITMALATTTEAAEPHYTYTPSGLKATLTPDGQNWSEVQIASMKETTGITSFSNGQALPQPIIYVGSTDGFPPSGTFQIDIEGTSTDVNYTGMTSGSFTGCSGGTGTLKQGSLVTSSLFPVALPVGPKFQDVLQSNQVFFVASNAKTFMADSQNFYNSHDIPNIVVADWPFEISPKHWRPATSASPTIMIFKYCDRSLKDMAGDTRCWSWPEAAEFNNSLSSTQQALKALLKKPLTDVPTDPLNIFYNDVVMNPNWNGFLFLNANVPLNELPPQIEGLAAGIDASLFFGHHIGVNLSPVKAQAGPPKMSPSAFFGYINYNASPTTDAAMPTGNYEFQVDELKVAFANSQIRSFNSKIQVTLNQLFGEQSTAANAGINNNIFLNGTYQHHDGVATYIFKSAGDTVYNINSPILNSVDITGAQFITLIPKGGLGDDIHTRFIFSGSIAFKKMTSTDGSEVTGVDLFSYDKLPFDNMWLDMSFNVNHPTSSRSILFDVSSLTFRKEGMVLHEAESYPFASQFPIKLKGLVQSTGSSSKVGKGYLNAAMPTEFVGTKDNYYALEYDLSLGTMGGLAPKKAFTAHLLLCWTPQENYVAPTTGKSYPAELRMKLPFTGSGGKDMLDIEGIIKLGLEGIQVFAADGAYTIKIRDFGLHILSLSIPPSGTTDIFLFGDPHTGGSALGWYAAYNKDVSNSQSPYSS